MRLEWEGRTYQIGASVGIAYTYCSHMVGQGVLTRSLGPAVTIVPPLTVTEEEIERIVSVLVIAPRELEP